MPSVEKTRDLLGTCRVDCYRVRLRAEELHESPERNKILQEISQCSDTLTEIFERDRDYPYASDPNGIKPCANRLIGRTPKAPIDYLASVATQIPNC